MGKAETESSVMEGRHASVSEGSVEGDAPATTSQDASTPTKKQLANAKRLLKKQFEWEQLHNTIGLPVVNELLFDHEGKQRPNANQTGNIYNAARYLAKQLCLAREANIARNGPVDQLERRREQLRTNSSQRAAAKDLFEQGKITEEDLSKIKKGEYRLRKTGGAFWMKKVGSSTMMAVLGSVAAEAARNPKHPETLSPEVIDSLVVPAVILVPTAVLGILLARIYYNRLKRIEKLNISMPIMDAVTIVTTVLLTMLMTFIGCAAKPMIAIYGLFNPITALAAGVAILTTSTSVKRFEGRLPIPARPG